MPTHTPHTSAALQELHDLQSCSSPEALAASPTAAGLRARRSPARLCGYAYELLTRHLQARRAFLMLGLLNERMRLEVSASWE